MRKTQRLGVVRPCKRLRRAGKRSASRRSAAASGRCPRAMRISRHAGMASRRDSLVPSPPANICSPRRRKKGERGIWQRRLGEHVIRDERDFERPANYIHLNPVKQASCARSANGGTRASLATSGAACILLTGPRAKKFGDLNSNNAIGGMRCAFPPYELFADPQNATPTE